MSQLRGKLDKLRASNPATLTSTVPTLADRIERVRPQTLRERDGEKPTDDAIAKALRGRVLAPGLVVVERKLSIDEFHGRYRFRQAIGVGIDRLFDVAKVTSDNLVFLDTETTGLAGGTGTAVFLLGLARMVGDGLLVRQYFLTAFSGEALMLEHAAQWLAREAVLVTYNGKSFDVPLLATRCRLQGVADVFTACGHLDLVHPVRRAFSHLWSDCRLARAEQQLLGFERVDDMPGAEAPTVWFEFLRYGDTARLGAVLKHNFWDLLSLAVLLPALEYSYEEPEKSQVNVLAIARFATRRGDEARALSQLVRYRSCLADEGLLELAALLRRAGRWQEAVSIWHELAERDCCESLERLAKYFEHQRRDYTTALRFTEFLIAKQTQVVAHRQRKARLTNKLRTL